MFDGFGIADSRFGCSQLVEKGGCVALCAFLERAAEIGDGAVRGAPRKYRSARLAQHRHDPRVAVGPRVEQLSCDSLRLRLRVGEQARGLCMPATFLERGELPIDGCANHRMNERERIARMENLR